MEWGSIEHRKKIAKRYGIDEQDVIDLSKENLKCFCAGLELGEKYGLHRIAEYMEANSKKSAENTQPTME